jgi:hypothetical protein
VVTTGSRDPVRLLALGVVGVVLLSVVAVSVLALALPDDEPPPRAAGPDGRRTSSGPADEADRLPPGALLPDLSSRRADELRLGGRGERRVLRFAAVLTNTGAGPLQVDPVPLVDCPEGQRLVVQTVLLDGDGDGRYDRRLDRDAEQLPGGCMLFHPRHEHWHFDGSAGYALTAVGDDAPMVARTKVSFCLRDSERNPEALERDPKAYPDCARDRRQGISVGWGDRYDATLPGQRLVLPRGLADGRYCLRLTADPLDQLAESDETNNSSAVVIRIVDDTVRADRTRSCTA